MYRGMMAVWHERCYGDVYSLDSQNERIDKDVTWTECDVCDNVCDWEMRVRLGSSDVTAFLY